MTEKNDIGELKNCRHCKKPIIFNKIFLHEMTCKDINVICDKCEEVISKFEIEEHKSEFHELSDCRDCGKKFEKRNMSSHKKKCNHKSTVCQFCDLNVKKIELHEHEYICGSKTEKCYLCEKYVPIREFDLHLLYDCHQESEKDRSSESCKNLTLTEKLLNSSFNCKNNEKKFCVEDSYKVLIKKNEISQHKKNVILEDLNDTTLIKYDFIEKDKKSDIPQEKIFQKPKVIKGEDFYFIPIPPHSKDDKINSIVLEKRNLKIEKEYTKNNTCNNTNEDKRKENNINQGKISDKLITRGKIDNKNVSNKRRILDEINNEFEEKKNKIKINTYNHKIKNKEIGNDLEENYYNKDIFIPNFIPDKKSITNNINNKSTNKTKLTEYKCDYPDNHIFENFDQDIIFDDEEIMHVIEKSKYDK